MLKHIIIAIFASILAIIIIKELNIFTHYLLFLNHKLNDILGIFIKGHYFLDILRAALALFFIPFAFTLIPMTIYYIAMRKLFPYYREVFWAVWILLVGALL